MKKSYPLVLVFFILFSCKVFAETPWIGEEGEHNITTSIVYEEFVDFWRGKNKAKLASTIEQWTVWLNYAYNWTDELAFSLASGYTQTHFEPSSRGDFSGIADTRFSAKYLINDEYADNYLPITVSAQAGAIIAGTYQEASQGNPHSPGDGANALEASLLFGKAFDVGISIFGDIGYRWRDSGVPNDLFFSAGSAYQLFQYWNVNTRYSGVKGQSGLDIGTRSFNSTVGFPQLKEVVYRMEYGLNWNFAYQHSLAFNYARVIDGRNTGQSDTFSVSYSYGF